MAKETTTPAPIPDYAERTYEILDAEREHYIRERRIANGIPEAPTPDNLNGLCISGGGVRSATLGLGLIQALAAAGKLKFFDYLSTVSGGGYIGSCLSSLLSEEPDSVDKDRMIKNENKRFVVTETGLDNSNLPFGGLNPGYEYKPLEDTKLTAKQQLNHLRRHGEYLTPNKRLFGWDVNRAIGSLMGGTVIHLTIFLLLLCVVVTAHHAMFNLMSGDQFMQAIQNPVPELGHTIKTWDEAMAAPDYGKLSSAQQLGIWYDHHLSPQIQLVENALSNCWYIAIWFLLAGIATGIVFIGLAQRPPVRIAMQEQEEQRYDKVKNNKVLDRAGGEDILEKISASFNRWFNLFCYLIGPLAAYTVIITLNQKGHLQGNDYFVMLLLPLAFSLGLFGCVHILVSLVVVNKRERVSGRLYRSFYSGMQGATILGLAVAASFPVIIIMLFGRHGAAAYLTGSFIPVIGAYIFTMQSFGGKSDGGIMSTLIEKLRMPLLNLSILLFVGVALGWVSQGLYGLERTMQTALQQDSRLVPVLILFAISSIIVIALGFLASSNDISLHYFYRDRLSEAYLRTEGRVSRPKEDQPTKVQPKGLFDVTLRNHENLMIKDLGNGNNKGPYHIIVAALNLQGSNDLSRRTLKSDHFIFSKYFIGSRTTGYVNSSVYNNGKTRLSSAMAISAAAVASGMGSLSFAASTFYMTLFNLRTGYWIDNPWYFIQAKQEEALRARGIVIKRSFSQWLDNLIKPPFWLIYLWRELTGDLGAETPKVNVSDGGHTGDNLGLLPLIQRECSTIVVADFEEDGKFSFGSFNQAVRLAKAIYDADIKIKLDSLVPVKDERTGLMFSGSSIVVGKIHYSGGKVGQLVYLKSSVNLLQDEPHSAKKVPEAPILEEAVPVFVLNYFKNNPAFPHQSTADQYFDEIQFEAYRMLGEHIGNQAAGKVQFGSM